MTPETPWFGCRGTITAQEKTPAGWNRQGLNLRAFSGLSTRTAKHAVEMPTKDATDGIGSSAFILHRLERP
jgi:hypothetical protein